MKRTKSGIRILSLMLASILLIGTVQVFAESTRPIYILDQEIDFTGDGCEFYPALIEWDETTNTLTMNDVILEFLGCNGITLPEHSTIILNGNSSIYVDDVRTAVEDVFAIKCEGALTIEGKGSLHINIFTDSQNKKTYGIYATDDVWICNEGKVDYYVCPNLSYEVYLIFSGGDCIIENAGYIDLYCSSNGDAYGIKANSVVLQFNEGRLRADSEERKACTIDAKYSVSLNGDISVKANGNSAQPVNAIEAGRIEQVGSLTFKVGNKSGEGTAVGMTANRDGIELSGTVNGYLNGKNGVMFNASKGNISISGPCELTYDEANDGDSLVFQLGEGKLNIKNGYQGKIGDIRVYPANKDRRIINLAGFADTAHVSAENIITNSDGNIYPKDSSAAVRLFYSESSTGLTDSKDTSLPPGTASVFGDYSPFIIGVAGLLIGLAAGYVLGQKKKA